jgi:hypothetical protein
LADAVVALILRAFASVLTTSFAVAAAGPFAGAAARSSTGIAATVRAIHGLLDGVGRAICVSPALA